MSDGLRRILVLSFVFTFAFLTVYVVRTWNSDSSGFFGFFKSSGDEEQAQYQPETFTLQDKPVIDLDQVEVLSAFDHELAKLTQAVTPSVVSIDTAGVRTERFLDRFGRSYLRQAPQKGIGSGVIISKEGHILTNHHVIADKNLIRVTLHDQTVYDAVLIGSDELLDIAVLRLKGKGPFPALKFGDSDQVRVGQLVFAIGNPFGLGETVTQGIISAKERSLSDTQRDLFQTDAAINPGNSGGPLINVRGEVIGINVAIFSGGADFAGKSKSPTFLGLGFSIPSNEARETMDSILKRGVPIRGFLGVRSEDLNSRGRDYYNYFGEAKAMILDVTPDSPAERAGLQREDVVLSFNGEKVKNSRHFITLVQRAHISKPSELRVWRKGQEVTLQPVIIDATTFLAAQEKAEQNTSPSESNPLLSQIGIDARDLTKIEQGNGARGVMITNIAANSIASELQLQPGDLIYRVNSTPVDNQKNFYQLLTTSASTQQTDLIVRRGVRALKVTLPKID